MLSVRTIAVDCLNLRRTISVRKDIIGASHVETSSLKVAMRALRRTRCIPAAPTGLRVVNVVGRRIDLAWEDNADNEDGYRIKYRGTGRGSKQGYQRDSGSREFGPNSRTGSLTNRHEGYEYAMRVHAFNRAGESARRADVHAFIPESMEPSMPGGSMPNGVSQVLIANCSSETLKVYAKDLGKPQLGWKQIGTMKPRVESSGPCPENWSKAFSFKPEHGTSYVVVVRDETKPGCGSNPDVTNCEVYRIPLVAGHKDGAIVTHPVAGQVQF